MSILQQSDLKLTIVFFFSNTSFDNNKNTFILDTTIDYIISTERFDEPSFNIRFCQHSVVYEILYSLQIQNFHLGLFVFIFSIRCFYYMYVTALFFTFIVCNCFSLQCLDFMQYYMYNMYNIDNDAICFKLILKSAYWDNYRQHSKKYTMRNLAAQCNVFDLTQPFTKLEITIEITIKTNTE